MRLVDAEFEEKHYLSMIDNPTPDVTENDKRTALAIARAFQMARTVEPERKTGKWVEFHGNKNMRICQSCGFMVNKSLLYDYTEKDPLVFRYCPRCGSDNGGSKTEGAEE